MEVNDQNSDCDFLETSILSDGCPLNNRVTSAKILTVQTSHNVSFPKWDGFEPHSRLYLIPPTLPPSCAGEQILAVMLGCRDNLKYDNEKVPIFIYALR